MLQANKVLMLARSSKKKFTKRKQPDESLKERLSIGHNVDLELTLSFLLGPVLWSLSTPDRIYTKTDKSKLQHGLQSHIEPTLDWPCSAAHNVDVNAVTTEHNSFSCHLHGSDSTSIQPGTFGFVTDTYV